MALEDAADAGHVAPDPGIQTEHFQCMEVATGAGAVRIVGESVSGRPVCPVPGLCPQVCGGSLEQVEVFLPGAAGVHQFGQIDGFRVGVRFCSSSDFERSSPEADQQRLDQPFHVAETDAAGATENFLQVTFDFLHGQNGGVDPDLVVAGAQMVEPAIPVLFIDQPKRRDAEMEELIGQFDVAVGQGLPGIQETALLEVVERGQLLCGFVHAAPSGKDALDDLLHAQFQLAFSHPAVLGTGLDAGALFDQFFRQPGRALADVSVQLDPRCGELAENQFQE